ncbi:MAG: hypothetical protein OES79_03595 [Planctomycetota bacterium]|nr:hypothetical protein [Planctomycetota bacterium]
MPKKRKCCHRVARPCRYVSLGFWLVIGLAGQSGLAAPAPHGGTASETNRLIDDAADGRLDQFKLIDAALIAEGVTDLRRRAAYGDQFRQWAHQLGDVDRPDAPLRQRAAMVLRFLHHNILTGDYDPDATRLATVFQAGQFNCVSSTVLFQAMCQEIELESWPVLGAGHVRCVVPSDGRYWLVETTSADWPHVLAAADSRADFTVEQANPAAKLQRRISPAQLLSVIYYNRAIRLLDSGHYSDSITANVAAWRVDPHNRNVRQNLLATINNWAVALVTDGQYADAAAVLATGRKIDPDYDKFQHNEIFVLDRWASHLRNQRRFGEAAQLLQAADRRHPHMPVLAQSFRQTRDDVNDSHVAKSQHAE